MGLKSEKAMESLQHKLDRIRKPRVQITYDLERGNAIEMKELPWVMGVLADLSGHRATTLPKIRDRKFIEISGDNFEDVMISINPSLEYSVADRVSGKDGAKKNVSLTFNSIDDFNPLSITKSIPELKELYEARVRIKDMLAKLDGNDELEQKLADLISDEKKRQELVKLLA